MNEVILGFLVFFGTIISCVYVAVWIVRHTDKTPKANSIRRPSVAVYAGLLLTALLFSAIFASVGYPIESIAVMVVLVVVSALDYERRYKSYGIAQSCPSCKASYAEQIIRKEELNRKGGYETVPRNETSVSQIQDRSSSDTTKWKTTNVNTSTVRYEQVHVDYVQYLNYLKCSHCGHQWTKISTSRIEG